MELDAQIEALLFYTGEPMAKTKLASLCSVELSEIENALIKLKESLANRGVTLVEKENEVMLGVHKDMSDVIETLKKDDTNKELSKASLETLSIILYTHKATRAEIDYIRGVNSSFIIRNLMIRGLIEKVQHEEDSRKFYYKPTFDLLGFLGIGSLSELPEYEAVSKAFKGEVEASSQEEN